MGDMGDMDMGDNHTHGDGDMGGGMKMKMKMSYVHMTFFWGKNSEILFAGWPGARGGMYALALVAVFLLALLLEWISGRRRLVDARAAPRLVGTAAHALRVGLAYLVMLAVMSFNGGVFIAAVAGHALGFLLFRTRPAGSRAAAGGDDGGGEKEGADVSPMAC